jgi:hypothetical protein
MKEETIENLYFSDYDENRHHDSMEFYESINDY